jgi:RNA polymerase sigma factor (TIGR02999 family)
MTEGLPVTQLLVRWSAGDAEALGPLTDAVQNELRSCARRQLGRRSRNHSLQPTALINEVWIRLIVQSHAPACESRAHFFGLASRLMRFVLIDHARARQSAKRSCEAEAIDLETIAIQSHDLPGPDILAVGEALDRLASHDDRKARIIEMRYFGGMSREEIGIALGLTLATVKRDLRLGEAWLSRFMSQNRSEAP